MSERVKINLTKKQKKIIIIITAVVAAIIITSIGISANKTAIYTDILYHFMPESVQGEANGVEIEFFVEKNKNFDPKKDKNDPMLAFSYYYFDQDGNRVDLGPDGAIDDGGTEVPVSLAFLPVVADNANAVIDKVKKAVLIIIPIVIVILIIVWFFIWSKQQDKQKADKFENINKNKKSKKKKK